AEHVFQNRQSPAAFVNHFRSHRICGFHIDPLVSTQFFQRDEPLSSPTLDCRRATPFVGHKIFQCPKQKRTKSSFFLADDTQPFALQQLRKKTLRNVLRLLWSKALSSDEAIHRSPISAAKVFQGLLCRGRFALRLQHHAPLSGGERDHPSLRSRSDLIS